MIDIELLEGAIDLKDPNYCSPEDLLRVYLAHRKGEKGGCKTLPIENTTATIGRILLYIAQLEAERKNS